MGYQIFTGYRLESLTGAHLDLFRAGFFGPRPWIILQNQSLAQWLKLFLARSLGGYATGDFLFQDEALRRLLESSGPRTERILFLDDLKWLLYRHLSTVLTQDLDPVFRPLGGPSGVPDPQRIFELADHIAGVFHHYAMNSTLWPEALTEGRLPPNVAVDPPTFAWQSRLWRDLLLSDQGTLAGLTMADLTRNPPPPGPVVPQIVLVGSAFLSRRASEFLRAWAQAGLIDVVHLLLLPAPAAPAWPLQRPWSSWGTFGRAFLDDLPAVDAAEDSAEQTPQNALQILQLSLASGRAFPATEPDETLKIVSCPHPLRELEILRDHLLAALGADPSLEVNEIAVLAPDINVYSPFLDAAFGSDDPGRHLRYHVIDLDLGRENAWFRALDAWLTLVSGTIDRPTLFSLVDTPAFQQAWNLDPDHRELWLDYTEEVSAWREGGSSEPQSWSASWDRLFEGWFRPGFDVSASVFRALGRFHRLIEELKALAQETRRARSLGDWIRFFDKGIGQFLVSEDGTGSVLSGRLHTLYRDSGSPLDAIPWAGFRALVQDQIAHFPGRRGQLLTEGIHCSSLRPLRAIPFRVVAVLGLDEGRFPRQSAAPSFDLSRQEPGQDAVSPLALDRYCFWETLMAARSQLYLSYLGRSPVDGSERPPSPVLADLMDYLEDAGSPWPVLQASVKDFSSLPGSPATASPRTQRRAAAGTQPPIPSPAVSLPPLGPWEDQFPEVRAGEVAAAFTAPTRFHLRRVRQTVLQDEDTRGVDEEEPWSLTFLDRQAWLHDGLRRDLAGLDNPWNVEAFMAQMAATGRVREGVFAERDRRDLELRARQVAQWATELKDEGWQVQPSFRPKRTLWAGRPWAPEPDDRLIRGSAILLPRLLYTASAPPRTLIDTALRILQNTAPQGFLSTLNPDGLKKTAYWSLNEAQTEVLAGEAEVYWQEVVRRPLPFYPDYLAALADRRRLQPDEPWVVSLEAAWRKAKEAAFVYSEATLARCPYAALAFAEDPDWASVADDTQTWWQRLFVPLLEAWTWE